MVKNFFKTIFHVLTSRLFLLGVIFFGMIFLLIGRVFYLQIVNGEYYLNNYLYQSERTLEIPSTRGLIYDRNGTLLAYNELTYAIVIADDGSQNNRQLNATIHKAITIVEKNSGHINNDFKIAIDENGNFAYTTTSDTARLAFLRDVYGKTSIDQLDTEKATLSTSTAEDVFLYLCSRSRFHIINDLSYSLMTQEEKDALSEETVIYSNEDALKIVAVRYALSTNSYQRYMTSTIASDVNPLTVAAIKESMAELPGVTVEEQTVRKYNNAKYYAHIIGYTGNADTSDMEELNADGEHSYTSNDMVGKIGIERYMEYELHGTKGSRKVYVDSMGTIRDVAEVVEPFAGQDVYLTIDDNLQTEIYDLLERFLAGILTIKIVNRDVENIPHLSASNRYISIKDAYYALFSNNILDITHFTAEDATDVEKEIYQTYLLKRDTTIKELLAELMSDKPKIYSDLTEEYQVYMSYIYTMLADAGILVSSKIDTSDPTYIAWRNDDAISLQEFLRYAITQSWMDPSKLNVEGKYSDTQQVYQALLEYISAKLETDTGFGKRLYRYMIKNYTISPTKICLLLFDQNVIEYNEEDYQALLHGNYVTAYNFFMRKIQNLELTPAQLALEPCSGSICLVDPNSGEVLALVTYPSYDNNRLSGSIDASYWSELVNDTSDAKPLINRATMTRTAPGSTFKVVSAIAGLEDGIISTSDTIRDQGMYTRFNLNAKCWIYPGSHGLETAQSAIKDSCNYFFYELGYRMSLDPMGNYQESLGLSRLAKYAELFGLNETSGVEITEYEPHISDEYPITSAIGQGNNNFTNIQLARYVATIANSGKNYFLTLLDKTTDSDGNLLHDYQPNLARTIDIKQSSWDAVHAGMYGVTHEGSVERIFKDFPYAVAGKTGTAEENAYRANHALFIGYAPYENPEIAVSVQIQNGYTSGYAAELAKNALMQYYDLFTEEEKQNHTAIRPGSTAIQD